jgi:hypothetical protein
MSTTKERRFGFLLTAVSMLVGIAPLYHHEGPRYWSLAVAVVMAVLSVWLPQVLALPLKIWMAFGTAIHHVISPVVMGVIFFCVFTPAGLLMRLLGKRPLHLRQDPVTLSYWIEREQPAPAKESMKFGF